MKKLKIFPSNNYGPTPLGNVASASENKTHDRNIAGEWALLVNMTPCKQGRANSSSNVILKKKNGESLMRKELVYKNMQLHECTMRCQRAKL